MVARRADQHLPEAFQADWHKMTTHEFPYNATTSTESGRTWISTTASAAAPDGTNVMFGMTAAAEGTQSEEVMKTKLDMLQKSLKPREH